MKKLLVVICLLLTTKMASMACLNTSQFKIFPVGIENAHIVSVDVFIKRTSLGQGNAQYNKSFSSIGSNGRMWVLFVYISTSDFSQKNKKCIPFDTLFACGDHYLDTLQKGYTRALNKISISYPSLELFSPEYISFCGMQKKCSIVSLHYDSTAQYDYLSYKGKDYLLPIIHDTTDYGFGFRPYYSENLKGLNVGSVRLYKSKKISLVVIQMASGDGETPTELDGSAHHHDGTCSHSKEYIPSMSFSKLPSAVYEEPLIQHSFGFDLFIVQK